MVLHGKEEDGVHAKVVEVKIVKFMNSMFLTSIFLKLILCALQGCKTSYVFLDHSLRLPEVKFRFNFNL